ncbi:MAG: hypothetical protein ABI690_29565 [Chloroflexota bacterium]
MITKQTRRWLIVIFIVGLVAYCLPWVVNRGSSLSFGAYDLAEWASLHPTVRGSNPALVTSLLLRLPLACFGIVIASTLWKQRPGWRIVFLLLVGIALLPPLEFFTQYRDDPNYQQQFALAVIAVLVGIFTLVMRSPKWINVLSIVCAFIGSICGLLGLMQSYNLMRGFELATQVGSGGILFIILNVGIGTILVYSSKQGRSYFTRTTL